jgi:hypothetical protein
LGRALVRAGDVTAVHRWGGRAPVHRWTAVRPRGCSRPIFLPESPSVAFLDRTDGSRGRFGAHSRPTATPRAASRTQRTRERPYPPSLPRAPHDPAAPPPLPLHRIWYTGQPDSYVINRYTGTRIWTGLSRPSGRPAFHAGPPASGPLSPCQYPHVSSPPRRTRLPDRRRRSSPAVSPPPSTRCIRRPRRRRGGPSHCRPFRVRSPGPRVRRWNRLGNRPGARGAGYGAGRAVSRLRWRRVMYMMYI